jgi:hypothetical protein
MRARLYGGFRGEAESRFDGFAHAGREVSGVTADGGAVFEAAAGAAAGEVDLGGGSGEVEADASQKVAPG